MGRNRKDLQKILEKILGSKHVYFQPPESVMLQYPCIIYKRDGGDTDYADDRPYHITTRYEIIVIDPNPDSDIPDKISKLPLVSIGRHYTVDNLNHDTFSIYF